MWTSYYDNLGKQFLVDQIGLWVFVRQVIYAQLLRERSKRVVESKWLGPDLVTIDTDFTAIRAMRDPMSQDLYNDIVQGMLNDGSTSFDNLVSLRRQMNQDSDALKTLQKNASRDTMQNIDQSVGRGQVALEVATTVRDLSATTLVVGATFLSGGAALGVLGAGSVLKGTARYQDTGNIGSAVLEAGGTFVVGMITMSPALGEASAAVKLGSGGAKAIAPAGISAGQRMVIVVVGAQIDAVLEASKAAIEGSTAKEALTRGGVRFITDVASGGAGIKLDRLAMPIVARLVTDGAAAVASDKGGNFAGNAVKPPVVAPKLLPIRDCNPIIRGAPSDDDYVRALVFRRA